jgi:hypothetical protein
MTIQGDVKTSPNRIAIWGHMTQITYAITYAFSNYLCVFKLLMRFQITYAFSEGEHKVPRLLMRFISEFTRSCTLANLDN